ncbi:hypothetical protein Sinac_3641 [Singulisphaera acidiphila DSM 18658]|uniref:Uncharacterized protein n=1 Tax=Singulisphaera acidiphila (strain ATCC BAA-1392 / DSM 18658 / VKM B-2454 / MOB10) TaxID=886293 RepID=L0DEV4_SINAD|nr:hypothetical protein Sinac_3641 [Singulisphaera acidiphila DSM 18658]
MAATLCRWEKVKPLAAVFFDVPDFEWPGWRNHGRCRLEPANGISPGTTVAPPALVLIDSPWDRGRPARS